MSHMHIKMYVSGVTQDNHISRIDYVNVAQCLLCISNVYIGDLAI